MRRWRGSEKGYGRALDALACCRRHGRVTGVATSVSASTFGDVVSPAFLDDMAARGAHYVWYYIYRPSGPVPGFGEALSDDQVRAVRRFLLEQRKRCRSAALIDAYWDHEGRALCPAATGISHHISAAGDVEPCPPVQCSDCRIDDANDVGRAVTGSRLLAAFRSEVPRLTRGCVLMDHPAELAELARRCGARQQRPRTLLRRAGRAAGFGLPQPRRRSDAGNLVGLSVCQKALVFRLRRLRLNSPSENELSHLRADVTSLTRRGRPFGDHPFRLARKHFVAGLFLLPLGRVKDAEAWTREYRRLKSGLIRSARGACAPALRHAFIRNALSHTPVTNRLRARACCRRPESLN